MSNMTQAWLSARDRPRQTHLSAHPAPLAWPAALALLAPTASEGAGIRALSAPPQPQHTQTTDGFVVKYFIAATPTVDTGGYEDWSRVYHSIFWNSAMASSTFLSSASVCWSWG